MQKVELIFDDLKKRKKTTTTTKKQLFSNRAVSTMQEWAIHPHRPTIPKCLYDDSSNHVNSILWFLYRSSSRTSSTVRFVIYFCLFVGFFGGTDEQSTSPGSWLQREVNSRSVLYQGSFT